MLDPELFYAAPWGQLYQFFTAGEPPLALRLLLINTVFLVFFVVRRARSRSPMGSQTTNVTQGLLIAANVLLMFAPDLFQNTSALIKPWI
jgi:hypothetical protein